MYTCMRTQLFVDDDRLIFPLHKYILLYLDIRGEKTAYSLTLKAWSKTLDR